MAVKTDVLPPRYARAKRVASCGMADIYSAEDTELGPRATRTPQKKN